MAPLPWAAACYGMMGGLLPCLKGGIRTAIGLRTVFQSGETGCRFTAITRQFVLELMVDPLRQHGRS